MSTLEEVFHSYASPELDNVVLATRLSHAGRDNIAHGSNDPWLIM